DIPTFELEELLGTKLRALYQRKKGRDLFDLSEALVRLDGLDPSKVIACFGRYMDHEGRRVTRAEFQDNLVEKALDNAFVCDLPPLLAPGVSIDMARAHERVLEAFVSKLPQSNTAAKKRRSR